ncbi:uncharacterized protein [Antedon mediterranea]|uniref:uncharacterized protein n=1 Tax=Antedon mediterranea TaxID=105859 RepID=UPI003AF6EAD1
MAFDDDTVKRKTPLQVVNKSPNFFRRNTSSQPRKRTAAEQLFQGRGDHTIFARGGENENSLNMSHNRVEYFNKNKKSLGSKTVPVRDSQSNKVQDDIGLIESRQRSRRQQQQREKMHRARSVERPHVESRLVITTFSSDDSDNEIQKDKCNDNLNNIPSGRVLNRITFFSNSDENLTNKPSAIKYDQRISAETGSNIEKSHHVKPSSPKKPPTPPKPLGYSLKIVQGKENHKETNITGTQRKKEPGYHIQLKDYVSTQENNNSLEAMNHERHRRVIEAKPLFPTSKSSTSNRTIQHHDKITLKSDQSGIGNSVLSSAKNRLAKNDHNAVKALSIDLTHSNVETTSKLSVAERLGVSTQSKNEGERKMVASHSFHYFPSDKTIDKKPEILNKPSQVSSGFVKKHVRQRSAPDANTWLHPDASPYIVRPIKDDNSIVSQHSPYSGDFPRKSIKQESSSSVKLGVQTSNARHQRKSPETVEIYNPSNTSTKPKIPEKPKKPIILKKPLNENVLKRIQHKNVMKTGFNSRKNNEVIQIKSDEFGRTGTKPSIMPSTNIKDMNVDCTITKHGNDTLSSHREKEKYQVYAKVNEKSLDDHYGMHSSNAKEYLVTQKSKFTKQYKPVRFQPRRKSSTLSTSSSIRSGISHENLENGKQIKDFRHETSVGDATSVELISDNQFTSHRSITSSELKTTVKPGDVDGCTNDINWKILRSTTGQVLEANEPKFNYGLKPAELKTMKGQEGNEYQYQSHFLPSKVFNEYSLSGVSQASKSKSSMKPLAFSLRHKPYEYSLPLDADLTGNPTKQYASVAPPTRSESNPACFTEKENDWRVQAHEYSTVNSKPTDRNLLVSDCGNVVTSLDQEGRIKQITPTGQDSASTIQVSRPTCPQHKTSYSSLSQTDYEQDIKMDRFFRPVVKRVNSWNDHVSRERRREKDSKDLYKKALKENKQKLVNKQQCKTISNTEAEKQENVYRKDTSTNVQFCNTKNVDNKPTAKELLIIRTEGVKSYRKPAEGNNNCDVFKTELSDEVKVVCPSRYSQPQHTTQSTQRNIEAEKNELKTRQASIDEVHEVLSKLNSSNNPPSPKHSTSPSMGSSTKNKCHSSGVVSHSIGTSDLSREMSTNKPTSSKNNSPDSVFVEDNVQVLSTESVVEATMISVMRHDEQSAMRVRRNSKELLEKRNSGKRKEKPQFLDLKSVEEKPDTGSNHNSLKRKQHLMRRNSWGSSSDVSTPQVATPSRHSSLTELDTFFDQMGLDDNVLFTAQSPHELDDVFHTMYMAAINDDHVDADSDVMSEGSRVSESGLTKKLKKIPDNTSSIITRNAKVIKWLCQVKKAKTQLSK